MSEQSKFSCAIITPEAQVLEGDIHFAALPAHDGEIGILKDRAPLLCKLGIGILRIEQDEKKKEWFIDGGFAQMVGNRLTILTKQAFAPESVNPMTARKALDEAELMQAHDPATQQMRTDAIARAKAQLRLAGIH